MINECRMLKFVPHFYIRHSLIIIRYLSSFNRLFYKVGHFIFNFKQLVINELFKRQSLLKKVVSFGHEDFYNFVLISVTT